MIAPTSKQPATTFRTIRMGRWAIRTRWSVLLDDVLSSPELVPLPLDEIPPTLLLPLQELFSHRATSSPTASSSSYSFRRSVSFGMVGGGGGGGVGGVFVLLKIPEQMFVLALMSFFCGTRKTLGKQLIVTIIRKGVFHLFFSAHAIWPRAFRGSESLLGRIINHWAFPLGEADWGLTVYFDTLDLRRHQNDGDNASPKGVSVGTVGPLENDVMLLRLRRCGPCHGKLQMAGDNAQCDLVIASQKPVDRARPLLNVKE
jgi:hypothetical protein